MRISSILTIDRCRANIAGGSKKRLLETLAELFAASLPDVDETALFQALVARERLGSTGIGQGIAIPHCRFDTGGETLCACITLADPIDFDAVDSVPIDVVFAMLVPENTEENHLQALAALAEALQDDKFAQRLRNCRSDDALYQLASEA